MALDHSTALFYFASWLSACFVVQVYAVYFKTNRRLIREYANLRNYTAEIYQMPGKPLAGPFMMHSLRETH